MQRFFGNLLRVLCFDGNAFFGLIANRWALPQSFAVLMCAVVLGSIHWIYSSPSPIFFSVSLAASGIAGWWIFAGTMKFLGQIFLAGLFNRRELLSLVGFATLPLVFLSLPVVGFVSVIWMLVLLWFGLRSSYLLKPLPALVLVLIGGGAAFITWGMMLLFINIPLLPS